MTIWKPAGAHGDVVVVRFADNIVVGFNSQANAETEKSSAPVGSKHGVRKVPDGTHRTNEEVPPEADTCTYVQL